MIRLYHRTYRVRLSVGKFRLQFQLKRQRVSYIATRCILYIGPAITWALYRLLDSRTARPGQPGIDPTHRLRARGRG